MSAVLSVDPGARISIPGVAEEAVFRTKGDAAEVAILTAQLLVSPSLVGVRFVANDAGWMVSGWRAEGPVCIYTCKRVANVSVVA